MAFILTQFLKVFRLMTSFMLDGNSVLKHFLNAGYDVNTPNAGKQFYWLNGEWSQSQVPGSIMIRPVVGLPLTITSIKDIHYNNNRKSLNIWPNPARDYINIDPGDLQLSGLSYISISDLEWARTNENSFQREGRYLLASRGNVFVSYKHKQTNL